MIVISYIEDSKLVKWSIFWRIDKRVRRQALFALKVIGESLYGLRWENLLALKIKYIVLRKIEIGRFLKSEMKKNDDRV